MKLEQHIGYAIPELIKKVLKAAGFDSITTLQLLTEESIKDIENFVNENSIEESSKQFKFLPGHRALLLNLAKKVQMIDNEKTELVHQNSDLSVLLKSLVEVAKSNANKNPKGNRYSDLVKYFSMYIYLLSGKACYETLCANLPIPKAETICK